MPRRHNPFNVASVRARDAEYQALWQACDRATRKQEYRNSTVQMRMMILREALGNLMEKRYVYLPPSPPALLLEVHANNGLDDSTESKCAVPTSTP